MRRRSWHLLFGAAAIACAAVVLSSGLRLWRAEETNRTIAAVARNSLYNSFNAIQQIAN